MVQQGPFQAELIYADTKNPFLEHTASDGQLYVEVEPDAEYFIRVQSHYPALIKARFQVDGEDLGYSYTLKGANHGPKEAGLFSRIGGVDTMRALVFVKTPVRMQGSSNDVTPYWTGQIKIQFREAIPDGVSVASDSINKWKGGDVAFVMGSAMDPSKKKGLKSTKGETVQQVGSVARRDGAYYQRHRPGRVLQTITLKYCSTVGLIHAGILPKPPAWTFHRMQFPAASGPTENASDTGPVDLTVDF